MNRTLQTIALICTMLCHSLAYANSEKHAVQTKTYAGTKAQAFQATLSVFQDNLYTDIRFQPEVGLFQAEMPFNLLMDSEGKAITRAVVGQGASTVLGGIFGGGIAAGAATDAVAGRMESGLQLNRVQATVEDLGSGKVSIRIVFIRTIQITETGSSGGGNQKTIESDLTDRPEVYEKIFEQISLAMNTRARPSEAATPTGAKTKK